MDEEDIMVTLARYDSPPRLLTILDDICPPPRAPTPVITLVEDDEDEQPSTPPRPPLEKQPSASFSDVVSLVVLQNRIRKRENINGWRC